MGHKHSLVVVRVRSEPKANLRARATLGRLFVVRVRDRHSGVMGNRVLWLRSGLLVRGWVMDRGFFMLRSFVRSADNGMMNDMSLTRDGVLVVGVVQEWSLHGLGKRYGVIRAHNRSVVNGLRDLVLDDLGLLVHREGVVRVGRLWDYGVDLARDFVGHGRYGVHRDGDVMDGSSMVHNGVRRNGVVVMVSSVVLGCWVSDVGGLRLVSNGSLHLGVVRILDDSLGRVGRSGVMHFMVKTVRVNHN